MARMHSRRKGKSGSTRPTAMASPKWVELSKEACEKLVVELAKEGKSASDIGRILRDSHGVPSVKWLTDKTVLQILKENKLEGEFPEDMMNLMKKAVELRKHLDKNTKDVHNRRGLLLIESKIKRLQKYYKGRGILHAKWYYNPEQAALLVK